MDSNEELIIGARSTALNSEPENLDVVKEISLENFERYILKPNASTMQNVAHACVSSELSSLKIRLNLWRVFLNVIPFADEELIREKMNNARLYYSLEFENFKPNKNMKDDPLVSNPLSKNVNSPWKSFFEDAELRNQIKKDVERTYQDKEIFQTLRIKNILTNVLFVWSKLNPDISYRQGMNEIAAIVTVIYFTESIMPGSNEDKILSSSSGISEKTIELFRFLNDENYAEADIFMIFDKIMKAGQQEMFRPNTEDPSKKKQPINPLRPIKMEAQKMSPILGRCSTLYEVSLKFLDKELFSHLKYYHVEPHIFLLRWIRCMTTREFHIIDSVNLWDSIFYEYYLDPNDNKFNLLDCVCLSMITYVRQELLAKKDDSACLQRLLKYPPVENVASILSMAWKYLDRLKNMGEEEVNPKPSGPSTDPRSKKEPIFFNAGISYKPPSYTSNPPGNNPLSKPLTDRKFEEKSENYPTIMENKSSQLPDFERKIPFFPHQHERPKSTNTQQKKEVADMIDQGSNEKEHTAGVKKNEKTEPIFKDLDEKFPANSPRKLGEFPKAQIPNREAKPSQNLVSSSGNNVIKMESIKERLTFVNGQFQDVLYHLDDEQSKIQSEVLKEELDRLKTMKKMVEECLGLLAEEKKIEKANEYHQESLQPKPQEKDKSTGFVIKKGGKEETHSLIANPLLRKK